MFHFDMVQFANTEFLLTKPHRVLNRSSKSGNVCYHKNQEFSSFTTNLQSKQKKDQKEIHHRTLLDS